MKLEDIMGSKISQTKKDKYSPSSLPWGIYNSQTDRNTGEWWLPEAGKGVSGEMLVTGNNVSVTQSSNFWRCDVQ